MREIRVAVDTFGTHQSKDISGIPFVVLDTFNYSV